MPEPAKAVFLSYASQDGEAAERIREALCAAGVEVWFDQSELRGGDAWDAHIRKQIKACSLFVPVISPNTQNRLEGYFRLEWKLAVDRSYLMADDALFFFPVLLGDVADTAARVPDKFREVHWTRLRHDETPTELAALVARLLSGEPVADFGDPAAENPIRIKDREVRPARSRSPWSAAGPAVPAVSANEKSVAVLAFANLSEKENEYFSDGISEELLNVLGKIPGLKVSARTSAFSFKGKDVPIPEIARQLGVAYVVEGSVRKSGDKVRIAAQLIKAADGFHVWSDTFTRDLKDIFAVQDDIARLIARNLSLKMGVGLSHTAVVNPEAYQRLLQARFFSWRWDNEGWLKSVEECKLALAIDPDFAPAAAEMARSYMHLARFGGIRMADGIALARPAAERAMALNPDLPEALNAMAWVLRTADWDWAGADASFRRAYELAPHNATMMNDYAVMRNNLGYFDEAIDLERQAIELDPLNSSPYCYQAMFLAWAGRIDEALKFVQHGVELAPAATEWQAYVARFLVLQGRLTEAAEAAEREPSERYRLYARALVQLAKKNLPEADLLRQELIDKYGDEMAFFVGENYAYAGEADLAFEWLERSRAQHETNVIWVMGQPTFRTLRSDPRWPVFLKKMGFDVPVPKS
ncbi:MAG TPA: TIR domain-containing protein [Opitutaceae bacterium]